MVKKQDYVERNVELYEENRKLLKALKKGSELAQLIKDLARAEERSLKLTEEEFTVFGEVGDLFQSSKDLTQSIKDLADILADGYKSWWGLEYNFDLEYPVIDMEED